MANYQFDPGDCTRFIDFLDSLGKKPLLIDLVVRCLDEPQGSLELAQVYQLAGKFLQNYEKFKQLKKDSPETEANPYYLITATLGYLVRKGLS